MENKEDINNKNQQSQLTSWYYKNRFGQWMPYPDNIQLCLEDCYQNYNNFNNNNDSSNNNKIHVVECQLENRVYQIDIKDNTQKNKRTGMRREILRIGDNQQVMNKQQGSKEYIWEYLGDIGWKQYDSESQKKLNRQYSQYLANSNNISYSMLNLTCLKTHYHINFSNMTQQNTQFKTIRKIRIQKDDPSSLIANSN